MRKLTSPLVALALPIACTLSPPDPDRGTGPSAIPGNTMRPPGTAGPGTPPAPASQGGATSPPMPGPPAAEDCPVLGPTPLRKLTRFELHNSLRDLLGRAPADVVSLLPEPFRGAGWLDRTAEPRGWTELELAAAAELAERAAADAAAHLDDLVPCPPDQRQGAPGEACAVGFIQAFGGRAWRRPLDPDETTRLLALYRQGRDDARGAGDSEPNAFAEGIRWVVTGALVSPWFLFHAELGEPAPAGSPTRLRPFEIAARLSFFLWGSLPDEPLAARARQGAGVLDPAAVRAETQRLLADPRARGAVAHLHRQWFRLDQVDEHAQMLLDVAGFTPAAVTALAETADRFVDHVFWEDGGRLATLLSAGYLFADPRIPEAAYGVGAPAGGGMVKRDAPAGQRAGLLTLPALLARGAWGDQGSPVSRGALVRSQLLCGELPVPPDLAIPPVREVEPNATIRQRLTQHWASGVCAACHVLVDPIGFGFGHFDGRGMFQTQEMGRPIDATGTIAGIAATVDFDGHAELGRKLPEVPEVRRCFALQWLRFGLGRPETLSDECAIAGVRRRLDQAGGDLRVLAEAVTATAAFTHRLAPRKEQP